VNGGNAVRKGRDVPRKNPFTALFNPPPDQWGLRGDPFLWRGMARLLTKGSFPNSEDELIALIEATFEKLTGARLPETPSPTRTWSL
jgi:hypothetical protein